MCRPFTTRQRKYVINVYDLHLETGITRQAVVVVLYYSPLNHRVDANLNGTYDFYESSLISFFIVISYFIRKENETRNASESCLHDSYTDEECNNNNKNKAFK